MKRRIVRGIAAVLCAAVLMPATAAVMPGGMTVMAAGQEDLTEDNNTEKQQSKEDSNTGNSLRVTVLRIKKMMDQIRRKRRRSFWQKRKKAL